MQTAERLDDGHAVSTAAATTRPATSRALDRAHQATSA
jgi:hypothetical protein